MAGGIRDTDDLADNHEINVTPFIDVMLVLLIIFMVAAPLATVDVNVDLPVSNAPVSGRPDTPVWLSVGPDLGLTLGELTAAQKKELSVKGGGRVMAATDAAARAGLREGDVILQLANAEVTDLKSFEAAWAKADKSKPVNVLVRRGDWAQYVLIRPSK